MIIKAYNENHTYLVFIDLEFNNQDLVQFAGLLFKKIDNEGTYQLMRSCNQYVSATVCYPFAEYTSITNNFLKENGVPLDDVVAFVEDEFLKDIDMEEALVISHGLKNDRIVMDKAKLTKLNKYSAYKPEEGKEDYVYLPVDGYCTFINARRILGRLNHLTLEDIAEEAGYYLHHAHNAYNDVWAEVSIFTYLKKIEEQEKR